MLKLHPFCTLFASLTGETDIISKKSCNFASDIKQYRNHQTDARMATGKNKGKIIDPIDFTPDTIQGILPREFALELVRRYKAVIAPRFDPAMKVMMFGSYAKDCPHEWSDIDVAVIVPKVYHEKWWDTAVTLGRAKEDISCYIEPILLESGEDSPIYREVMRTGIAV